MSAWLILFIVATSLVAGATASVVGFGIGSLLTPLLALRHGADTAVVMVAIPHLAGSMLRGWRLRHAIDTKILIRFGILSAAGGLAGAFLFTWIAAAALTQALGVLLIISAIAGITDRWGGWHPHGAFVWIFGGLSGFCGGVAGNQGGLRAAALSAFGLAPTAFVATSTAIGIVIDLIRTPFYLYSDWDTVAENLPFIIGLSMGVMAGTLLGERLLFGLSPKKFRTAVSVAIGLLGMWFLCGQ